MASTSDSFRTYHFEQLSVAEIYPLMIRSITPRPIAWVSTCDSAGVLNLAPFSYFCGVCSAPPTLAVSVANRSDGSKKDTLNNIETTGEFVVNIVTFAQRQPMVQTSVEYPPHINEFEMASLSSISSVRVRPPRVAGAPIQMECRLRQIVRVGDGAHAGNLVLGEIVLLHVATDVLDDRGKIDHDKVDAIGRMGGLEYTRTRERMALKPNAALS